MGGILSFLSPCVLPLIPAYLGFVAGASIEDLTDSSQSTVLTGRIAAGASGFVLGFTTIFVLMGASAAAISHLILTNKLLLGQISGALIILFGLHFMGVFRLAFLNREASLLPDTLPRLDNQSLLARFALPYGIGMAFAFGWTPCIGPILAAVLAVAAVQESMGQGVALLAVYSLGLGIPFLAAAFGVRAFMNFFARFRRHLRKVEIAAGALLVATGILMMVGSLEVIAIWMLRAFPSLAAIG